jgi:hypothetical protein
MQLSEYKYKHEFAFRNNPEQTIGLSNRVILLKEGDGQSEAP